MKSGFYGAAIAAVAGLALGAVLKGPFSAEAAAHGAVGDPSQNLAMAHAEAAAWSGPRVYAPVAYAYSGGEYEGGGAYLRAAYEADPAEALLQQAAWQEPAASPVHGFGSDVSAAGAERSADEAHAAGMTTPAVRPDMEAFTSQAAAGAPSATEKDFESIDALIGTIKPDSAEPA